MPVVPLNIKNMKIKKTVWKFIKPNEMMFVIGGGFFILTLVVAISMYRNSERYKSAVNYENLPPAQKASLAYP